MEKKEREGRRRGSKEWREKKKRERGVCMGGKEGMGGQEESKERRKERRGGTEW